jgi:trimeric autotransporter adhesin
VTLDTTNAVGVFANKNIGTGKVVTVSGLTLLGPDAAKYTLTQPTASADITAKGLTVTGAAVTAKVYDGTTVATITGAKLSGVVDSEVVSLANDTTGDFDTKDIGLGKSVSSAMTLAGADAGNYTLAQPRLTGDITAKELTVTGITASDKAYDGSTAAPLNTVDATLVGPVTGDVVTLDTTAAAGAFTDAEVGTNKMVLVSGLTLSGGDAGNYTLAQPTLTADISPASSTTALVSSENPSLPGSKVTFTATVSPVSSVSTTPTGTVQFYTNAVATGTPVVLTAGVATLVTAGLPSGTNTVLAAYLGDGDFLASTNSLAQVVSAIQIPSTVSIQENGDGTVTVTFAGTPNGQYVVEAADSVAAPVWENISTNTAGGDGRWNITEPKGGYSARFYRSAKP